ncbi:MAG: hypothetical protein M1475_03265 [Actinobacteria bacterium]|nr:hypothetical protein [Actinomycetota bacterium]
MKNIKKFLIASIILIAIGAVGLVSTGIIFSLSSPAATFGTGTGYTFRQGNMMGMMRGFNSGNQYADIQNISFEKVKSAVEKYLNDIGLQNVKVKEIMEFSNNYYIETIEEKTGFGAIELLFDKTSGAIFPEYGPNMMWNQKYGMMNSGFAGNQYENNMRIDEQKAIELANNYLSKVSQNEFAGDEGQKFYGYYTIDTVNSDGAVVGMLSVNGFTGQVWYHSWHGTFIEMKEYE